MRLKKKDCRQETMTSQAARAIPPIRAHLSMRAAALHAGIKKMWREVSVERVRKSRDASSSSTLESSVSWFPNMARKGANATSRGLSSEMLLSYSLIRCILNQIDP